MLDSRQLVQVRAEHIYALAISDLGVGALFLRHHAVGEHLFIAFSG